MNTTWFSLPDGFFDNLDDCAAYIAVSQTFGDHVWWYSSGAFGIPLHEDALASAARWALINESEYRESMSTTSHRLVRHPKFEACLSELLSKSEATVHEKNEIDGTDFSDLDIFDETKFPELSRLAVESLGNLLALALTLNKG